MGRIKCVIQLQPLQTGQVARIPSGGDVMAACNAAGLNIVSVSDLLLYGFVPKPVSLEVLPSGAESVDPVAFKRLRKVKYISSALLRELHRRKTPEAISLLCRQIGQGVAVWQGEYLYECTEDTPSKLDYLNPRLENPFVKQFSPQNRFWCFLETEDSQKQAVWRCEQLNIAGYPFAVRQVEFFEDSGENHLLTADLRVLPGSVIRPGSKSLYRIRSDGQSHSVAAGAVLDPRDKINRDPRCFAPFILKY